MIVKIHLNVAPTGCRRWFTWQMMCQDDSPGAGGRVQPGDRGLWGPCQDPWAPPRMGLPAGTGGQGPLWGTKSCFINEE